MKPAHIASRRARALVAAFLLSAATHAVPAQACRCAGSGSALMLPPSGRLPEDAPEGTIYLIIGGGTSDNYAPQQAATPPASPAEPDDDNDALHLGLAALAIALLGIVGGLMVRASRNWSTPWADALAEEQGGAGVRQHAGAEPVGHSTRAGTRGRLRGFFSAA